jgi:hypothetical protein
VKNDDFKGRKMANFHKNVLNEPNITQLLKTKLLTRKTVNKIFTITPGVKKGAPESLNCDKSGF